MRGDPLFAHLCACAVIVVNRQLSRALHYIFGPQKTNYTGRKGGFILVRIRHYLTCKKLNYNKICYILLRKIALPYPHKCLNTTVTGGGYLFWSHC